MTGEAVHVRAVLPGRGVDVDLVAPAGRVLAVLGPNGAGKSSVLGLVAGLLRPDPGSVRIGDRVVADARTWVRPPDRGVALLAQRPLLFPHLRVVDNVAFGPRSAGAGRRVAARVAHDRLVEADALDLADRRPHELSGGQAQRVALARALAPDPRVVLLDEPLASLDVAAGAAMRRLLRRVVREAGRTALLVTHDLVDVLALADAVVVLDGGRVVEQGATLDVLTRPRSPFTAQLAGVNLVPGTLREGALRASGAAAVVLHGLVDDACRPSAAAVAAFSPRAVAVHRDPPGGSPRNAVRVRVVSLEHTGELVRVRGRTADGRVLAADITPASVAADALAVDDERVFAVKAAEVTIYPA
ncbi:sulfate/molybdate ABC transporter ATP-binding protein [Georgenia faecalis]|uniref:sulfate/molybdate ABC transporter ATP-binding protein n=1 Tax=Georgenia faecalis TaxID=2483799 RepID=UPI000FDC45F9|nr:ATP-binding cassette domain-containing protein [Georgenia faecalis]